MSSDDNDVTDRILEGNAYDQAEVTVRRTFPLRAVGKLNVAAGVLWLSGLLAPVLYLTRARIRATEGTGTLSETLSLVIVDITLIGVITTLGAALVLARQLYTIDRRSLSEEEARRLIRTEDLLMLFVVQGGLFVLIPVAIAVAGAASGDLVETLYGYGVTVYAPGGVAVIDARHVSAFGVGSGVVLFWLSRRL
ncbi:MAG: hypothetical protein ACI9CA_001971 [Natronomonas sp.]|jgi:hypothetical protein